MVICIVVNVCGLMCICWNCRCCVCVVMCCCSGLMVVGMLVFDDCVGLCDLC